MESCCIMYSMIGMKGRILKKLIRDTGNKAAHCSRWGYLQISREVNLAPVGSVGRCLKLVLDVNIHLPGAVEGHSVNFRLLDVSLKATLLGGYSLLTTRN